MKYINPFSEILSSVENSINSQDHKIHELFEKVPLEVFGLLPILKPTEFPGILNLLPKMPPEQVQINWTGNHGHQLLKQSILYIKDLLYIFSQYRSKNIKECKVLDFGCGWGRLTRLLYKYFPKEQIYGVDPWDQSLKICKECNLTNPLYLSDYIPEKLPFDHCLNFDLIFAFSVFTHLSERTTHTALNTLSNYLDDEGLISITIRPVEFWEYHMGLDRIPNDICESLIKTHNENGFAFYPHQRSKEKGEITYGDTSISFEYIEKNFPSLEIESVEYSSLDSYQINVFLSKS